MFKSVYEFTKAFSIILVLSGAFFLFKEMFFLAFIAFFSFFMIKFIDSDWAFDNLKFSNHNLVVILITFGLIFINIFAIYQSFRFSPIISRIDTEDKESYLVYENALYDAIKPCSSTHNMLYAKMNAGEAYDENDIKLANNTCYKAVDNIEKQVIPGGLNNNLSYICMNIKNEFKKMAINLAIYKYSPDDEQKSLANRIRGNLNNALKNMSKIREMMQIQEEFSESKKTFIQL